MTSDKPNIAAAATNLAAAVGTVDEHGGEKMTSKQADELRALEEKHGGTFDATMSRDAAAERIAELKDEDGGPVPPQS